MVNNPRKAEILNDLRSRIRNVGYTYLVILCCIFVLCHELLFIGDNSVVISFGSAVFRRGRLVAHYTLRPTRRGVPVQIRGALELFRVELETMELDSPEMYPSTLEEIKAETRADPTLSVVREFVAHGWPSNKSQVPTALRHYYPLRDELAVYHGVVYKSHKVLIPVKLQSTMLKKKSTMVIRAVKT